MNTFDNVHSYYENEVQYPYAEIENKKILHISKVTPENRNNFEYTCPCCHKRLRPRLGKKNRSCFFHVKGSQCSMDKYIHNTAERLLQEKWLSNEPFEITMNVKKTCSSFNTCRFAKKDEEQICYNTEKQTFDLKKYFDKCILEQKIDKFIPDLQLIDTSGKHEPIFIEIWSKHHNSEEKMNSKFKIIEIRIKSIEDLEKLPKNAIIESDTTSFLHFEDIKSSPENFVGVDLYKYTLSHKLTSYCTKPKEFKCYNSTNHEEEKAILEIIGEVNDFKNRYQFWDYCDIFAREKNFDVKSCKLCELYRWDETTYNARQKCWRNGENSSPINCQFNEAKTCHKFTYKDSLKTTLIHFNKKKLDIWTSNKEL